MAPLSYRGQAASRPERRRGVVIDAGRNDSLTSGPHSHRHSNVAQNRHASLHFLVKSSHV